MKIISIILGLFLVQAVVIGQAVGPQITSPEIQFDFGDIAEGVVVTHEFEVFNSGDEDLVISKVKASCGCTAAQPEKDVLKSGESTKIKVQFNSSRRSGKQRKSVYVFSNDKVNPQYKLAFTANILKKESNETSSLNNESARLVVTNKKYNFGDVVEGRKVDLNVQIKNVGGKQLNIDKVKSSCGCTATLLSKNELKPGESTNLKIELDTSGRKGQLTRTVTIHSNDPIEPQQIITLSVNIENGKS
jgi:hypothetical protein